MSEDKNNPSKTKSDLNADRSALLISRDGRYRHNLSLVADKVHRLTNLSARQSYIFLRRFVDREAGGARGITVKIARELNLKRNTSYIPLALRNIYQTCPEPEKVRDRARRKDFKTSVLSKAHQAVLTLMFIKTVNPDVDISKIEQECKLIFDHYLPDISMIASGEFEMLEAEDDDRSEDDDESKDPREHKDWKKWVDKEYYCAKGCEGTDCPECKYRRKCIMHKFSYHHLMKFKRSEQK